MASPGVEAAILRLQAAIELRIDRWASRLDSRFERLEAALEESSSGVIAMPSMSDNPCGSTSMQSMPPSCAAISAEKMTSQRPSQRATREETGLPTRMAVPMVNMTSRARTEQHMRPQPPRPSYQQQQQQQQQQEEQGEEEIPTERKSTMAATQHREVLALDDLDSGLRLSGGAGRGKSSEFTASQGPRVYKVRDKLLTVDLQGDAFDSADEGVGEERSSAKRSSRYVEIVRHRCVLPPASQKRLWWDVIGMILIIYDLIVIPLQLAFQLPLEGFMEAMTWASVIFWSIDIPMTFFTGYYEKGTQVMSIARISLRYFKTWFAFDIGIVCLDWLTFLSSGDRLGGMARISKSLRVVRIARALRLLRLMKLQAIIDGILEHIESEYIHIAADMAKGMSFVFGLNHVIACVWYGISSMSSSDKRAWMRDGHFEPDDELAYRYLTALHWSITQFTPASMEVFPCNTHERAFTVVVLIFALLVLSSFLSSITASVTQLRHLSWRHYHQSAMLRRYLRRRSISAGLSMRIMSFVDWKRHNEVRAMRDSDVVLLGSLSEQLRVEMTQEICEPTLCGHPFFCQYGNLSYVAMGRICSQAVRRFSLSVGDIIFDFGMEADSMIFLLAGRLSYVRHPVADMPMSALDSRNECSMEVGDWCSEAALWTKWVHAGTLQAQGNSEVLAVDAMRFLDVTVKDVNVLQTSIKYSTLFINIMNEQAAEGTLSDLISRHMEFDMAQVSSMDDRRESVQQIVNFFKRQRFSARNKRRRK